MTAASNEVVAKRAAVDAEQRAWELLCQRLHRDPAASEESDTCTLRAAWKAMLAFAHSDPRPVAEGLREGERLIGYLFGTDRNTDGPRVVDLCFTAFMGRDKPNPEDGGKSDWFTDTKPNIDRCIAVMKDRLLAALATHSPAPMAGEGDEQWAKRQLVNLGYDYHHLPKDPQTLIEIMTACVQHGRHTAAHPSTQEGGN